VIHIVFYYIKKANERLYLWSLSIKRGVSERLHNQGDASEGDPTCLSRVLRVYVHVKVCDHISSWPLSSLWVMVV